MCDDHSGIVDLNASIADIEALLLHVIQKGLVLRTELDPKLGRVAADPRKITRILLNLAVRAQLDMPPGGELVLSTKNVEIDEATAAEMGITAGQYAQVDLRITGGGLEALPDAYDLVREARGGFAVRSSREGTAISIVLPRLPSAMTEPLEQANMAERYPAPAVLVVDDDPEERRAVATILQQEGYEVVEAANGKEAEAILADSEIELMITAIVMPEQDGLETIVFVRKSRPDVKIIAVSGDPADFHLRVAKLLGAHSAINKPLSREELIAAVQTLIGAGRRGEGHLRA